jgi:simple sugar transport system ATP-binding protein
LTIHRNEVVAITGLLGSGKTKLASSLFGMEKPGWRTNAPGRQALHTRKSPEAAIAAGVFMSPKDRASNGVIPTFDITQNLTLPFTGAPCPLSFLSRASEKRTTNRDDRSLGVVCQGPPIHRHAVGRQPAEGDGGRWMAEAASCWCSMSLSGRRHSCPPRYRPLHPRNGQERATIVFAAELDEALEIADRISSYEHSLVGEHRNETSISTPF